MTRSVVTGGSGFIGSHLVDELMRVGHEVAVLDRGVHPHRPDVEFLDVDLADSEAVLSSTRGCDYVFHLGTVANFNMAVQDPANGVRTNVLGSLNMLEAARRNDAQRFILASSVWVYSGAPQPNLDETSPFYVPRTGPIYSSSKIAAELLCHDYWRAFGLPFTVLRYGAPYGPRMRESLVIHAFITRALAGEPFAINGDGKQFRNFIYVEELAHAHSLALGDAGINQTYNLDGPEAVTISDLAETIARLLDRDVKIEHLSEKADGDPGMNVSIAKAYEELGWQPTIGLEEGLLRTIEWYEANR